ncbi:MAG TPA: T9SS type A sorting domain-containing protein [Flavobacteriales bacterium]|nr:T9SS type A sorting domain-containing protein [Flavobacteriales bacterium]HPH82304.1 T9SS type A sorting domain-containing protein [Flavobacteriales bacterium]
MNKIFFTGIIFSLFFSFQLSAQELDPTFGNSGKAFASFGFTSYYFEEMEFQSSNKIIAVGDNENILNPIVVCRLKNDGSLDSTFQGTGILTFGFGFTYEFCDALVIDSQDRILLGGSSNGDLVLARLLPDGDFDTTFSTDGKVKLSFGLGNGSKAHKILIQNDGKIVAIGEAYGGSNFNFAAARFHANGVVDSTFGVNGLITHDVNGFNDFGYDALLLEDGKILIGGTAYNSDGNSAFAWIRLLEDGTIDTGFASNGKLILNINSNYNEVVEVMELHPNGKIISAGYTGGDFAVLCMNIDGVSDASFGSNGHITTDFDDYQDKAYALKIDAQGKIILAGHGYDGSVNTFLDFAIARYTANGSLDNTFSSDGKLVMKMGTYSSGIADILIQDDGKLLFGGQSFETQGGFAEFGFLQLDVSAITNIPTNDYSNFQLYPNPVVDKLTIRNDTSDEDFELIQLYSITGQLLNEYKSQAQFVHLDVSTLNTGIYIVNVQTSKSSKTFKFIKQ